MEKTNPDVHYGIWAADNIVYGPVELPTLLGWIQDERVTADTWVFEFARDRWRKADQISELQLSLRKRSGATTKTLPAGAAGITTGMLRRIKSLAEFSDEQLERLLDFMEPRTVRQFTQIVKQGEMDDGMYLVLEGELRVRLMISGQETILAALGAGDCFGEIALFDEGPRSADVIANCDSVLLKVGSAAFERLRVQAPELAAPMLFAISRTLAARIRADNKRIKDSVALARSTSF
jgi:CRP/FNR family transcriptional regulator, cyclic AMP receptor protein